VRRNAEALELADDLLDLPWSQHLNGSD
jgi:hypothetical protein